MHGQLIFPQMLRQAVPGHPQQHLMMMAHQRPVALQPPGKLTF